MRRTPTPGGTDPARSRNGPSRPRPAPRRSRSDRPRTAMAQFMAQTRGRDNLIALDHGSEDGGVTSVNSMGAGRSTSEAREAGGRDNLAAVGGRGGAHHSRRVRGAVQVNHVQPDHPGEGGDRPRGGAGPHRPEVAMAKARVITLDHGSGVTSANFMESAEDPPPWAGGEETALERSTGRRPR